MRRMLPEILLLIARRVRDRRNKLSFHLWNSGIGVFISGCFLRGIINISGRFTEYDKKYWIVGGVFFGSASLITI